MFFLTVYLLHPGMRKTPHRRNWAHPWHPFQRTPGTDITQRLQPGWSFYSQRPRERTVACRHRHYQWQKRRNPIWSMTLAAGHQKEWTKGCDLEQLRSVHSAIYILNDFLCSESLFFRCGWLLASGSATLPCVSDFKLHRLAHGWVARRRPRPTPPEGCTRCVPTGDRGT